MCLSRQCLGWGWGVGFLGTDIEPAGVLAIYTTLLIFAGKLKMNSEFHPFVGIYVTVLLVTFQDHIDVNYRAVISHALTFQFWINILGVGYI